MSYQSEQAIRRELTSGETLLWTGQPGTGLRLRPADALMIPFSLLWAGFAVFWEVSVFRTDAPFFFRADRSGTITFGAAPSSYAWMPGSGWPGLARQLPPSFDMVEHARDRYTRIREAQQATTAAADG